jgi:peptidyl-prolyl cis-trans isomerase C
MKKHVIATTLAAIVAGLSANAIAQNIAIVNGKAVPKSRIAALEQQVARSGRPITPEVEEQIKTEVIAREIFMQEAQKSGLDATDDYKSQLELARQTILIRQLFANFMEKNPVTEADAKAEYDKLVASNKGSEYHARHILVETEAQANDIIAKLKKGAKFDELAKKLSKDPGSGANGGDLGWAAPGNYVKEFSDALMALKKGETTQTPVKSQFGYHIIRLEETRETQAPKFDDVKTQLIQQMQQQRLNAYQDELRSKAKVE